jgi:hypothetical protein
VPIDQARCSGKVFSSDRRRIDEVWVPGYNLAVKNPLRPKSNQENPRLLAPAFFSLMLLLPGLMASPAFAATNSWHITQLPYANVIQPTINNSGEMVWSYSAGGIASSVRGDLSLTGYRPHLANSGEVVFADWFGGPQWDLVSTTRGRLTYDSSLNVDRMTFDVNSSGEVVYGFWDANGYSQVFSTVRNQITSGNKNHDFPCINDAGEIIWLEYPLSGPKIISSTRGVLPDNPGWLLDLNNNGEICSTASMEGPPGFYSTPHVYSSAHGLIINDYQLYQWDGGMNDAGTVVWTAPDEPGSSWWHLFKAVWGPGDLTPPNITQIAATPQALWPPNQRMIPVSLRVDAADEWDPSPIARIIRVTSNGPANTSASDWEITGPLTVNLRATPPAKGQARVYTIIVESKDESGNASTASVTIRVSPDGK